MTNGMVGVLLYSVRSRTFLIAVDCLDCNKMASLTAVKRRIAAKTLSLEIEAHQLLPDVSVAVSRNLTVKNTELFASISKYLSSFVRYGGVIEAYVPCTGTVSASMLIDPTGYVSMVSSQDVVMNTQTLQPIGCIIPQSAVPHRVLFHHAITMGQALSSRGVRGYVDIDFVVCDIKTSSIHSYDSGKGVMITMNAAEYSACLINTDCNIRYSPSILALNLLTFVSKGRFSGEIGTGRWW